MKVFCDYCGRRAEFMDSAAVYNDHSYGMIYMCRPCDAYVGVHKGSKQPLGRLANSQLRCWKKAAHAAFDPLWKSGRKTRSQAYSWLAQKMGLPQALTHIGMFDVEQCKKVVNIMKNERSQTYARPMQQYGNQQ